MNHPTLVIDASVALKWLLPEEGQTAALSLLDLYQDEELDLVAPYLLIQEVAAVLWKRVRRGEISPGVAQRAFVQLLKDAPILVDSPAVNFSALRLAAAHSHPVAECLYLAWALEQRCDLMTADERFFDAMHSAYPCVQLLRQFQKSHRRSSGF